MSDRREEPQWAICPICRENMIQFHPVTGQVPISALFCGHTYHQECVEQLFVAQLGNGALQHCAVCRAEGDDIYKIFVDSGPIDDTASADKIAELEHKVESLKADNASEHNKYMQSRVDFVRLSIRFRTRVEGLLAEMDSLKEENERLKRAHRDPPVAEPEPSSVPVAVAGPSTAPQPSAVAVAVNRLIPPPLANVPRHLIERVERPSRVACFYCGKLQHWSFLCTRFSDLEQRQNYIQQKGLNKGYGVEHRQCEWFSCLQFGHLSSLCPRAPYPITPEKVEQYIADHRKLKEELGLLAQPY